MVETLLSELKSLGDPQIVKIWKRHGAGNNLYGVSLAKLKSFAKKFKKDNSLALQLWETGNLDSQFLATMICEPRKLTKPQIQNWLSSITYYSLCDVFVNNVAYRSTHAIDFLRKWTVSDLEYHKRAGYILLSKLAGKPKSVSEEEFEGYLEIIRSNIHKEPNRSKEAMNLALIAIGKRSRNLNRYALITANNIGTVEIDHGDTNCKTPHAPEVLADEKIKAKIIEEEEIEVPVDVD